MIDIAGRFVRNSVDESYGCELFSSSGRNKPYRENFEAGCGGLFAGEAGRLRLKGTAKKIYKMMGRAIFDYRMLSPGDRILLAFSGGLDSAIMLKLFELRKRNIPIDFDITACFIDMDFMETDKAALRNYAESCGFSYMEKSLKLDSRVDCFWCSWDRRKLLFKTARELDCNKIALGHNLDDMTETILMNIFFRGEISSSPPALDILAVKIKIIRPLCYIPKKAIAGLAREWNFKNIAGSCPYAAKSNREKVRNMMRCLEEEGLFVKKNVFNSLKKVKRDYLL